MKERLNVTMTRPIGWEPVGSSAGVPLGVVVGVETLVIEVMVVVALREGLE